MALSQDKQGDIREAKYKGVHLFYKKVGETPLQALHRLRIEQSQYAKSKLSYAGRLDPLAEGELLVLEGEACAHKENYLGFNKTYTIEVLFGISTDTGDVLGKIKNAFCPVHIDKESFAESLQSVTSGYVGKQMQSFPKYSSRNIKKVLKNEVHEEEEKEIEIYSIDNTGLSSVEANKLQENIIEKIHAVSGDFRQKEILTDWQEFFENNSIKEFTIATMSVHCSSGTYMRVLAEEIGKKLGLPALALHINRTKIHI